MGAEWLDGGERSRAAGRSHGNHDGGPAWRAVSALRSRHRRVALLLGMGAQRLYSSPAASASSLASAQREAPRGRSPGRLRASADSGRRAARAFLPLFRRARELEEASREGDRVREDHDAASGTKGIAGQLAESNPHEPDLEHLALHVPEGPLQAYAIADSYPVWRNHREVARESEDDVLEGERNARGGEAEPGHQGGQLAGEMEDQHEGHGGDHHDVPGHQEESAPIRVVHVAHGRHAPDHAAHQDGGEHDGHADEAQAQTLHDLPALAVEGRFPAIEVAREATNEGRLAPHGHDDRGELLALLEQRAEGLLSLDQRSIG